VNVYLDIILLVVSLLFLTLGAESLVKGSSSIAIKLGITPLVVGLTVVAFCTSSPEMVVNIAAVLQGQSDIAFGNVVGSNIFNIGVILGLAAVICPISVHSKVVQRDGIFMLLVSGLMILLGGDIPRITGVALFLGVVLYTWINVVLARREVKAVEKEFEEAVPKKTGSVLIDLAYIGGGLVTLVLGSRLLVSSAVDIARALEVSEAIIGLTIIAAGTGMPELATSVVAAFRRQPDIAVGNVIGSNIFNILAILGISSIVSPIKTTTDFSFDIWVMVGFSALALPLLYSKLKLERWEGGVLVLAYLGYLAILWPN
jgi:cation:H+ antiporter